MSTTSHSPRESNKINREAYFLTGKLSYASAIDCLEADKLSVARSLLRTRHAEEDLTYQLMSIVHEKVLLEK